VSPLSVEQDESLAAHSPSWADMRALASAICQVAGNRSEQEQAAVAWSILNRVSVARNCANANGCPHPLFGDGSILGACAGHLQKIYAAPDFAERTFCRALSIACLSFCADLGDPTSGATHFHCHQVTPPQWTAKAEAVALIGDHIFYRLQP